MKLKLPTDGKIIELNMNKPSKIHLNKYNFIISFDPFTKIDGCRFDQLCEGDKISIHNMIEKKATNSKYFMCTHMVITDIHSKWNDILKNDSKYSIIHKLEKSCSEIRPEEIEPSIHQVKRIPITDEMSHRDKTIISLYHQGKPASYIAENVNLSKRHINRIIKSYKKDK